jgi:hypothetical protein
VVVAELLAIAFVRYRFMRSPLVGTIVQVIIGGGVVFAIGISAFGSAESVRSESVAEARDLHSAIG